MKKRKKFGGNSRKIIILFVVIGFIILSAYIYNKNQKAFNFAGVKWKKINSEGIDFYYSKFMIIKGLPVYDAIFRNDPRENNIEIANGTFFKFNQETFFIFDESMKDCGEKNLVSGQMLAGFLNSAGVKVKSATNNLNLSKEGGYPYLNCWIVKDTNQSAIIFEKSDYPHIWQPNKNCYVLRVGQCESVKTAERFIIANMIQLKDIEEFMTQNNK